MEGMKLLVMVMVCVGCLLATPVLAQNIDVFTQHGAVSWYELMTSDPATAVTFYTDLFGWTTQEDQMADGTVYTTLKVIEQPFGGVMKTPPQAEGAPPYWALYVTVNDVVASAAHAQELGGQVLMPPMQIEGVGHFAVIQDPQGAVISLMSYTSQSESSMPAEAIDPFKQHGAMGWYELMTSDLDAAVTFYTQLFGWATAETIMENGEKYMTIKIAGQSVGGMTKLPPEPQGIPSYWGIYITVTDADATAQQAQTAGANILMPPTDVPDIGRFAVLQDPQGAVFAIMSYVPEPKL